jgi:hypothetical protein
MASKGNKPVWKEIGKKSKNKYVYLRLVIILIAIITIMQNTIIIAIR